MDLEDEGWVNVPYEGLLEVHDDGNNKKIFSRKFVKSPAKLFKSNYFSSSLKSQNFVEDESRFERQVLSFPTQLDQEDGDKEIIKHPILINESKQTSLEPESDQDQDQDPIFNVFFTKENKFVEMKMDSQESNVSRIDICPFQYEEKSVDHHHAVNCSSPTKMIKQEVVNWEESNQRLNFWKWGLSGIGAFCSMGITAATICIIIFGSGKRHKHQNQKLSIQIYSDNKRIKQVVEKAHEAMSVVRGVPLVKAQITYGGYYESL